MADTTGELRDWTAHAEAVVIGKSFLGTGGQNPTEAIMAGKPVLTGLHMENLEPLISQLREAGVLVTVADGGALRAEVWSLSQDSLREKEMVANASRILDGHRGATLRTVELLQGKL